jgi:hypothetical protein
MVNGVPIYEGNSSVGPFKSPKISVAAGDTIDFVVGNLLGLSSTSTGFYGKVVFTGLPTTVDQCKNNGWRTFLVFMNQGDCVSFVATRGKNPPRAACTP